MYAERGIADRYCCWLHIISPGAWAKAAASWGVNYLLFQQIRNTEEYQDKLPLSPRFVSLLSREAGDMGTCLCPIISQPGQGPAQREKRRWWH